MPIAKRAATPDANQGWQMRRTPGRAKNRNSIKVMSALPAKGRKRIMISIGLLVVTIALLAITRPFVSQPRPGLSAIVPGLTLEDIAQPKSVVVTSVQGNSIADDTGIKVGDRVVAIDTRAIASRADLRRYLDGRHPRVVDMQLVRRGRPVELIYAFPQRASQ